MISKISAVYYNPEIPGHSLIRPAVSLENKIKHIFSPIRQSGTIRRDESGNVIEQSCCEKLVEVIKRVVIAPFLILAYLPMVLFAVLVGLPVKAISARFLHPSMLEERDLRPLSEAEVRVESIPGDGNCALTAFMRGMRAQGSNFSVESRIRNAGDLRVRMAEWIANNVANNSALDGRLRSAIQEEVLENMDSLEFEKTSAINASQERATYQCLAQYASTDAERNEAKAMMKALSHRSIERIDTDLTQTSTDLVTVTQARDVFSIRELANHYLSSIQDNRRRVYAGHAHFYAMAHMWNTPMNILIYEKVGHIYRVKRLVEDYRLRSSNIRGPTIRLLHESYGSVANHYNLIHLRS